MNLATIAHAFLQQEGTGGKLNAFQLKVLDDIIDCRTPKLGGHIMACPQCGCIKATYNSCGNRNCPKCGSYKRDKWALMRKHEALPVKYFHVVFTVPHDLNPLFTGAPRQMYNLLLKCAWETISKFGKDHKYLGGQMGMVAVLHTWGQNISIHPHAHCLVPGGGLDKQGEWREMKKSNGKFLFPVKALSRVFSAKYVTGVSELYKAKKIKSPPGIVNFFEWLNSLYKKKWVVYAKKPVPEGASVVDYIARYTHKVAISNSRIIAMKDNKVKFSWLDYRTSKIQNMELGINEFIRRFLLHVLPKGFVKIRHYGFMACRNKAGALGPILLQLGEKPRQSLKGLP